MTKVILNEEGKPSSIQGGGEYFTWASSNPEIKGRKVTSVILDDLDPPETITSVRARMLSALTNDINDMKVGLSVEVGMDILEDYFPEFKEVIDGILNGDTI
jgi:hypothetical protein